MGPYLMHTRWDTVAKKKTLLKIKQDIHMYTSFKSIMSLLWPKKTHQHNNIDCLPDFKKSNSFYPGHNTCR